VPIYEDLYDRLGGTWRAGSPSTLEQQMVVIVDRLATSPVPAESLEATLGLDGSDIPRKRRRSARGRDAKLCPSAASILTACQRF
jgi:hypothetical protein